MSKNKSEGILESFAWKFFERISAQLVTLIISIVLARILSPSDYGIIAIVNVFIALANIFVAYGFGNSLIQKKDADELDYSSVLFFNIGLTVFLYSILFFCAPLIAKYYGQGYEILTPVLRVLGLRLIITGINSVQQAYVAKKMIFRKFFISTIIGTVVSACVGILMAYHGFGVWSLVAQYLSGTVINTIVLGISLHWKPIWSFSFERLKEMWKFGSFVLVSGILMSVFEDVRALIIGKVYSSENLAFYDKGKQFPNVVVNNTNTSISTVLFPKMSSEQDNLVNLKNITRKSIRFSSFVMCPLLLGLFAVSKPFVLVVLTEKWLPCVILLQGFCLFYLFQPMHTANIQAIKAVGRSDIFFKLEIFKKIIEIIVLIATIQISVVAMVYGMAILSILFTFVNAYPNKKLLNYTLKEQMLDVIPAILNSVIMAIVVYPIAFIDISNLIKLCLQIFIGVVVYIILALITKNKEMKYLINLIKSKLLRKKGEQK